MFTVIGICRIIMLKFMYSSRVLERISQRSISLAHLWHELAGLSLDLLECCVDYKIMKASMD